MFESARVKLTLFYLATILVISLMLTFGIRALADRAFDNSSIVQRARLQEILHRQEGLPFPDHPYDNLQTQIQSIVHHQLTDYVIEVNIVALVFGGAASYWFAGRTLRPIEEAHAAQARFASDASHELRTPLTVMKTENEVFLRQKDISEADARKQIKSNLEEIQRLEQLAANLLSIANYEEGERLKLSNIKATDISKLTMEQIKQAHPKDFSRIKVDVSDIKIYGHKESLAQILNIFLDNAIKYSPNNKTIYLVGNKNEEHYKFAVEDSGPGIDSDDMPMIFDRLFRADRNRSGASGHGLGLSLAKEIAKVNGAGLGVSNVPSGGARFTLTIQLPEDLG
jgi:signal transduction histidine kinase